MIAPGPVMVTRVTTALRLHGIKLPLNVIRDLLSRRVPNRFRERENELGDLVDKLLRHVFLRNPSHTKKRPIKNKKYFVGDTQDNCHMAVCVREKCYNNEKKQYYVLIFFRIIL